MAQGEVLEGKLAVAAAEEREEAEEVEQGADHGTAIVCGSGPKDQPRVDGRGFGQGQARYGSLATVIIVFLTLEAAALILLFGAEVIAEGERVRSSRSG